VAIALECVFFSSQSAHQHQESGLGKMKVGQQTLHHMKLEAGIDKQIRFAGTGTDLADRLPRGIFQCSHRRSANRYYTPLLTPGSPNFRCRL